MRRISASEAVELGLVAMSNAKTLNPAGAALAVVDGKLVFFLADGGHQFTLPADVDPNKRKAYRLLSERNLRARLEKLGFVEQFAEPVPVRLPFDDRTVVAIAQLVCDVVEGIADEGLSLEQAHRLEDALLARLAQELGARWQLYSDGTLRALAHRGLPPDAGMTRIRYLIRQLREMTQPERTIRDGADRERVVTCQLKPSEVKEFEVLADKVESGELGDEEASGVRQRLEDLFGLAADGMLWWRGDPEARMRLAQRHEEYYEKVVEWRGKRDEVDRLLEGEIKAADVKDVASAAQALEERLAPLKKTREEIVLRLQSLELSVEAVSGALEALRDI